MHREPKSVPAAERPIVKNGADNLQRQFEAIRFLGVDGELEIVLLGEPREIEEARRQLVEHPVARNRLVARMQRRELDRNAGAARQRRITGIGADRFDRGGIGVKIFFGIGAGARGLAEHIERIAEVRMTAGAVDRVGDVLSDDEMRAEEPHRLPRRRAHRRQAEAAHQIVKNGLWRLARMNDAGGDAERPGRSRDQNRGRFDVAVEPAAGGELVFDQAVCGRGVGHAKERLGQHHERQPLLGRQRISVQKIFDAAEAGCSAPDGLDKPPRAAIDAALRGAVAASAGEEACRHVLVGRRKPSLERWHPAVRCVHAGNLSFPAKVGEGYLPRASKACNLSMLIVQPISMPCR